MAEDELGGLQTATTAKAPAAKKAASVNGRAYKAVAHPESREIEMRGQRYKLRESIGAVNMMDLALTGDDDTSDVEKVKILLDFIDSTVVADQAKDFRKALRKSDPPIEMEELQTVIESLIEVISGRPTEPPQPSSDGR